MIRGDAVTLRTFSSEGDCRTYYELYADMAERSSFDHTEIYPVTQFLQRYEEYGLWRDSDGTMIIEHMNRKIIGDIGFRMESQVEAFVGYRIFRERDRGRGLGMEALRLFSRYLFETKQIERITLRIGAENVPSKRVAEKCGFQHEGTLRNGYFYRGHVTNMDVFGLLRADLEEE